MALEHPAPRSTAAQIGRVLVWVGLALAVVGIVWYLGYFLTQGALALPALALTVAIVGAVALVVGIVLRGRRSRA
ncbi:hypothetical protein ACF1AJ_20365 [Leifsonia sp. NPDC014704]|uniref:hypothetical protein n=1 Tax=Leifsonia sp. NPDC014704 TaxID=3364123 RepID=UPI0036F46013